jgi:nucleoside-diphosphate-sugar epimerase
MGGRHAGHAGDCLVSLLVFGFGFTAQHGLERFRSRFGTISGTVRSPEKAQRLSEAGVNARLFGPDATDPDLGRDIAEATHILLSIPPDQDGDPVLRRVEADLAAARRLAWIGYLSTIGVYGDQGGAWVEESAPANPTSARSRQRVRAEGEWLDFGRRTGVPVQVFRLAGIYGQGRNALVNLREGKAKRIAKPGQVFNRIHAADIVSVLLASMERPRAGAIYNVADDEPAAPQDVVAYAAALLGVPAPPEIPFDQADMTPMARSFYADNKRVSNRLIKEELGVTLAYPTYREGLRSLHAAGEGR